MNFKVIAKESDLVYLNAKNVTKIYMYELNKQSSHYSPQQEQQLLLKMKKRDSVPNSKMIDAR